MSAALIISHGCTQEPVEIQKLVISDNHRFLVLEDGTPFVWIGETNWFFSQLPPETIDQLLDKRKAQGYTIMFVSCRQELYNGKGGTGPLENPNESWWSYLDDYIEKCETRGLYVGITLGWWGKTIRHSPQELYDYGKWVGERYSDKNNIIWLTLGEAGSHLRKNTIPDEKLNALIDGIRAGDTGNKLLTVHADYRRGTSLSNDGNIYDFNNWQISQWGSIDDLPRKDNREWTVWEAIEFDYNLMYDGKPKPTLDSEAWYENNKDFCGATAFNIRRRAYFTIFAGAFGHTYGAGGIWDGLLEPEGCSGSWLKALEYTGAADIGYLSRLLQVLGKDFIRLRPHQDLIVSDNTKSYDEHIQACTGEEGKFALVYSASDMQYDLDMGKLNIPRPSAMWYNPREGKFLEYPGYDGKSDRYQGSSTDSKTNTEQDSGTDASPVRNSQHLTINPPGNEGAGNDWVLITGSRSFLRKLQKRFVQIP